ncbi:MAG TPA: hypothetical protein VG778_11415, partial [Blastocatellia bacterium]|nr:hypothetical protein [Blastocatellia bacterium]
MMIEICIVILSLLQAEPRRIPIVVWVGAILVLLIGLSLLIYFLKRLKKTEKEAEEDWSLSRRSLFAEPAKASAPAPDLDFDDMPLKAGPRAVEPEVETAEELAPTLEMAQPVAPAAPEPVEEPEPETVILRSEEVEVTPQEVVLEERVTELLVSPVEPVGEGDVLGDDVWEVLHKPDTKVAAEPPLSARVEQRPQREPFEPPSIRPIAGREPFEAPRIERIVPQGNQTSERQLPPPPVTAPVEPPGSRETALPPVEPLAAREIVGSGSRKPAGTVLGIPVESSHGPLILGEPVKPKDEVGIGALANYGKETGPEGGRGGTIALLVTVVLVGGG